MLRRSMPAWFVRQSGLQRLDGQRVYIAVQQVVDRCVNQSMPREGRYAAERLGHDANAKVALSSGGAGMTGV